MAASRAGPVGWQEVLRDPVQWLAFGFGTGLLPVAPGTWGSLLAAFLYWWLPPLPVPVQLAGLALAFVAGCVICGASARRLGVHDHGGIVFDEFVGQWLVLVVTPHTLAWYALAFVLFRLMDIWKPWPIREADHRLQGGTGIMLDDVLAAGYAALVVGECSFCRWHEFSGPVRMVQLPSPSVAPAASAEVPDKIGKYPIIKVAGKGTTGTIYLSHDPYFRRDVAIKVYATATDDDPQRARIARKMFFNEAHMVGMLQHPNILPIYDAGEEDGKYYVVMEHVQRARTLEAYCRPDNLLHIEDVVKIIFKCAKALHYAHKRGVIHRDIKPSNIMLTNDNDVRIIDFGIAILLDADISRIEGIAGSPSYMSPEQVQGFDITPASDLYSLGAVMYELLTGFRPFRGSSLSKLLNQIVYATPPPIHTLRLGVPDELEEVVAIALQKDPARRYANGGEFGARLTRVYQQLKAQWDGIDRHEHFDTLRRLSFFHDFSQAEIHDLLRASEWREYMAGDEIVREGTADDRFYVIVTGRVSVESNGREIGMLNSGDCFGETGYVSGARSISSFRAQDAVTVLSVSSTILEQVSTECQLRFNKVFLRTLIRRLQGANNRADPAA